LLLQVETLREQLAAAERRIVQLTRDPATKLPALPVGTVVSDFDLPDLDGNRVTLSEWQGRSVLLIFFDPTCGYSRELLPTLATLSFPPSPPSPGHGGQAAPADDPGVRPMPLLISRGDRELNWRLMQAHGVTCPVLLQEDREVAALYSVVGSPTGYLIDARGRTATPLLVGPDALLEHAAGRPGPMQVNADVEADVTAATAAALRPRGAPRLFTRWQPAPPVSWNGLPAGTPAPDFRVPRLDGGELALLDYRGRRVLLVFWDPACTPCDAIAPGLEALHRACPSTPLSGVQVLVVSRGDLEANRLKAARYGLTVPIGLQSDWAVSRSYRLLGAPVAYLVDGQGVISADVAVGRAAITAVLSTLAPAYHEAEETIAASDDVP
jgi:peroxiredoxin